jgi:pulcherriminic acid synthase
MSSVLKEDQIVGRNGVVITRREARSDSPAYRTYEVYQRERVGESTEKIKPKQLVSEDYRLDPYPIVGTLRENYPSYRDWLSNSYWITQYNDVTSIFTDDANFETRPKTWYYGLKDFGRDLRNELPVLVAEEAQIDAHAAEVAGQLAADLASRDEGDLATGFAAPFAMALLAKTIDLPEQDLETFTSRYWRMQRGTSWNPALQKDGRRAIDELVSYFEPIVEARRQSPGEDTISAMLQVQTEGGPITASDVVVTMLEGDHETLHGALANLWFLLMTNPLEFEQARSERRLMKLAYLETIRHSTPVITAYRFARHEVERFGKLLPEGARLTCSAAAGNRDPRVFKDPDTFIVDRKDMCQREPRGQYRADGLATGITFGLGKPSPHPAVPEDRPRSRYSITRDTAVTASQTLLEHLDGIRLAPGATPHLASLSIGEMHTCWKLPVVYNKK